MRRVARSIAVWGIIVALPILVPGRCPFLCHVHPGHPFFCGGDGGDGFFHISTKAAKQDIAEMGAASEGIWELRPVTFRYREAFGDPDVRQYGLIAEDVAEVYPELVVRSRGGSLRGIRYETLIPMLLNELQKERQRIAELEARVNQLDPPEVPAGR